MAQNKNGTLIYFSVYPFNEDYGNKYGFSFFQEYGFDIKVFDVLPLVYNHLLEESRAASYLRDVCGADQVRVFDYESLNEHLKRLEGKVLAFMLCRDEHELISLLRSYDIEFVKIENLKDVPPQSCAYSYLHEILYQPRSVLRRLFYRVINYISGSVVQDVAPRYVLSRLRKDDRRPESRIISVNSFDYDRVLQNMDSVRPGYLTDDEYYVLLVNHPFDIHDSKLHRTKAITSPGKYASIINRFLDFVEEKTGVNVWIAAYPKATEEENIYNGRPFIYDTEQLVKYSSGVIGHHTGAFNFAVAHGKPICLIDLCDAPSCSQFRLENRAYASEFRVPIHCIDSENDCLNLVKGDIFSINKEAYAEYRENYLMSEGIRNRSRMVWEVFLDVVLDEYFV